MVGCGRGDDYFLSFLQSLIRIPGCVETRNLARGLNENAHYDIGVGEM